MCASNENVLPTHHMFLGSSAKSVKEEDVPLPLLLYLEGLHSTACAAFVPVIVWFCLASENNCAQGAFGGDTNDAHDQYTQDQPQTEASTPTVMLAAVIKTQLIAAVEEVSMVV